MNVVSNEKVACECGLKRAGTQTNVISNECGLVRMWSQMNRSQMIVVSNNHGHR